jgi:hypothetical protein
MIVYSGKQFWNDFNNWDEGLFQDANRPRDDDKFQIRPWVNSRKNDLRVANSWIAAQGTFYGNKLQAWQQYITDANGNWLFNTADIKNSYRDSDIVVTVDVKPSQLKTQIYWKPYVNADGKDVVVGKEGCYAITAIAQYFAPTWYDVTTSYTNKFYVALLANWQPILYTQARGCGGMDTLPLFYIGWFGVWDRVNVGFLHTYLTNPFSVISSMNLYRLS